MNIDVHIVWQDVGCDSGQSSVRTYMHSVRYRDIYPRCDRLL
jgi:hypothetical protein